MPTRDKESYSIHSVDNALAVLEALCDEPGDVQISRLSEKLGMNKTSVFRLLATFENRGYVEREEQTGRYRLGLSAYEVGQKLISRMTMLRQARPVMERLARECDEAVYLALRRDDELLFLDMVDTPQQVKIISLVGKRYPLSEIAAGSVILAHSPTEQPLSRELAEIHRRGWASGHDVLGEGIACLSVPLFNGEGTVPASLSFLGPDFRLDEQRLRDNFLPPLREAGQTISSKLGFLGSYLNS
ncbi:IclR family transcriptional regulator [Geothermobacter hydrogeniphilus]|uniref:Transcriptional regulator, IclR family n=1 Tax=Geothermobacter hydrogeniphilus TaxID=1969733 RepID=A0A1X0XSH8_9BACT|nr:IclR family transcriptional regulator [Geothermobacter hydrogeniphilus]ORJ55816.1 hypothetical protein B5V00_15115 [Geothermobacter hydrogeniphilus]